MATIALESGPIRNSSAIGRHMAWARVEDGRP